MKRRFAVRGRVRNRPIGTRTSSAFVALVLLLAQASCAEEAADAPAQPSASDAMQVGGQAAPAAPEPSYEDPPVLEAKNVLDAQVYKGPHYRIDDRVKNDGAMNHFRIASDYGEYRAGSEAMLTARLHEIEAIAALKEFSSAEVVADAAKEGAVSKVTSPIRGAQAGAHAVMHPKETMHHLSGVGHGAMRVFKRASHHAQAQAETVSDAVTGKQEVGDAAGEMVGRTGDTAGRLGSDYSGYGEEEMEIMQELGINPYTDNQVLLDEVHRVAGLEAAVRVGFKFVPGIPGTHVLGQINKFRNYAHDFEMYQPPGQLQAQTRAMANQMGIPADVYESFQRNPNYNPAVQSILVGALHSMKGAKYPENFLKLAADADDAASAYFYMMMAEQLAVVHRDEIPIVQLVAGVRIPAGLADDGRLIVPLPVDHLVWTEEIAGVFRDSKRRVREEDGVELTYSELRIRGTVSPTARAGLEAMDMKVLEQVDA